MKRFFGLATAIVFTAAVSVGITHSVMQENTRQEVSRMEVEAFNDGWASGTCHHGEDGFGNRCYPSAR